MRLAFYTYSYTDRLKLSIPDCFARIAKTGYAGIDESSTFGAAINSDSVTPERRKLIRETARRHKLRVEAIITHAELTTTLGTKEPLDLKAAIDLAADLGGDVVTFHLGGPRKDVPERELWKRTVAAIKAAADHGDSKHVSLAIDLGIWPEWIVTTSDALARLFDDVGSDSFGVNFDPSYLAITGIDPVAFAKRFGPRIRHVHLKDHIGKFPKWEHRIPGQGEFDYMPIIQALARAKFTGALAVECFTDMKFEEACDAGYVAMAKAFAKAGVPLNRE
ncbi:MAG: sugar phosphate isomerase/epimerase family protein [Deltaproteobacteria bacterium]